MTDRGEWQFTPAWDVPAGVTAVFTGSGGDAAGPYGRFNLGAHVGDDPARVERNRAALIAGCADLEAVQWLDQVHGFQVARVNGVADSPPRADAAITTRTGMACAVLTADCLPVLLCDHSGTEVAAAHAGWRGLLGGVLVETVGAFAASPASLSAWLGPCIRQPRFEVGAEVRRQFLAEFSGPTEADIAACFVPSTRAGHFFCDLAALAERQLRALGLEAITDSGLCAYDDPRFFSHRRAHPCGRFASLIYRRP